MAGSVSSWRTRGPSFPRNRDVAGFPQRSGYLMPQRTLVALSLTFGLWFAPGGLAGQVGGGQITYATFTLPNGLRVVYAEDHTTPVVSVDLWYKVGSRNERPGRSGFAHLFEHLMFEGSAHAPKGLHSHLIESAGGQDNASTAEDRTNFYETVPSNRCECSPLGACAEPSNMRCS